MRKNVKSNSRKSIDTYDRKTFMRIQFMYEICVYRRKSL